MSKTRQKSGNILFWLVWPGLYFHVRNSSRARVIVSSENKMLFVKDWLGRNQYSLPGGGLKRHEVPIDGAIRELFEETGLKLDSSNLKILIDNKRVVESGIPYNVYCFETKLPKITAIKARPVEILAVEWLPWENLIGTNKLTAVTNQLLAVWLEG